MIDLSLNYGQALYDLAKEDKLCETVMSDLKLIGQLLSENGEYTKLLDFPGVEPNEKEKLVDEAFKDSVSEYSLNFLKLLSVKKLVHIFEKCRKTFEKLYDTDNNIEHVVAVTAAPLKDEAKERLVEKLKKITGKNIELSNRVDEKCLGGVILRFNNYQIDGSIKTKLENMKNYIFRFEGETIS